MLTIAHAVAPEFSTVVPRNFVRRRSLLTCVVEAFREANQRRAECEVARFIESHGGELTDDLEREISRRFESPVQWGAAMPTSIPSGGSTQIRLEAIARQGLRRGLAVLVLLRDAWVEARELQRVARQRYPFADW
jgi:hypothetical protein